MKQAVTLVAEAKKQEEESLLRNYELWAKEIAYCVYVHGFHEVETSSTDKTFSKRRHFIRHLRKIGFKVDLLSVKHEWRKWYTLAFRVTLDNTDYKEDAY